MPEKEKKDSGPNPFQKNDIDAPDDTIGIRIKKIKKIENGVEKRYNRKIYNLEGGAVHIVDIEEA